MASQRSIRISLALSLAIVGLVGAAQAGAGASVSVTITAAPASPTASRDATVAFTVTGSAKRTQCRLDGDSAATCTSPVTYSGLPLGTHKFVVKVTDSNNNTVAATASWEVVSSTLANSLTVTSTITSGSTLSGSLPWEAKPSSSVSAVDFYIDGALKSTERLAPYVFNGDNGVLDTKSLSDGDHVLRIVATGTNGAKAETSAAVKVANGTPPPSSFTVTSSIADGSTLSGSPTWQVTASQAVSTVDFYVDGALKWTERLAPYVFNGDGSTLNTTTLADGSHVLKVVGTASNGARAETSATVRVANGATTSLIVSSSIANGTTLSGSVVWEANPNKPVNAVGFYIDGTLRYTDTASPHRYNGDAGALDTRTLTAGSHTLRVLATAPDTTTAQTSSTVTVSNSSNTTTTTSTGGAGDVQFAEFTGSSTDSYTNNPTSSQQQWMRDHWTRAVVYSSYWDSRLGWYPNGWGYLDSYAIYRTSTLATQHPDWILKDAGGNNLYIPWGCSGGVCPQYAADIGNPAWRQYFIGRVQTLAALGYKGVFIDDVNMDRNVGNGSGQQVAPIDPRTGAAMTDSQWKLYFADFLEQVRAAVPGLEIVHNSVWFAGGGAHDATQPEVVRQIRAADWVNIERGFTDGGLTGGTGSWSVFALMRYIDNVHSYGANVILMSYAGDAAAAEYNLAGYLLVSNGRDLTSTSYGSLPGSWWSAYDTDLGDAKGGRYQWNGVWRRDFTNGFVLLNEPGATAKTLSLGGTFTTSSGARVTSMTLGAASGAVLKP
jgi:Hypothetical glycosyl hydrolase family 15/Bacterial Ig domain